MTYWQIDLTKSECFSIYPSIEAAEENLEEGEKFHEQTFGSSLKDEFLLRRDIDYFFQT